MAHVQRSAGCFRNWYAGCNVAAIAIGARRYLDEPSTGMDPLNKRLVWDALLRRKAGRVSEHSY